MTKQELINWAESKGYQKDKFGHMQKTFSSGRKTRLKIQANSVRYEEKITFAATEYSGKKSEWLRLNSGYLKDTHITPEGKISFKKEIC
jgi:hypothetical protein